MQKGWGRDVSAEEADRLSQGASRLDKLFPNSGRIVWYKLSDGSMLARHPRSGGRLYTADEFEKFKAERAARAAVFSDHYLGGRDLPEDFPDRIQSILPAVRNWIGGNDLEPDLEGLDRLDDVCDKAGREKCLAPPLFERVVAVVGETMRLQRGGQWEMRQVVDMKGRPFYEAWIIDGTGWEGHASLVAFDALDRPAPLRVATELALGWGNQAKRTVPRRQIFITRDPEDEPGSKTKH